MRIIFTFYYKIIQKLNMLSLEIFYAIIWHEFGAFNLTKMPQLNILKPLCSNDSFSVSASALEM